MRGVRTITIGCAAAALLALASCSSGGAKSSASAPTATTTVTVTETATVTASASASAAPTASATKASGPECGTAELSANVRALDAGAGQRYAAVVLTNASARSCTVTGYPGLQLVASTGKNVPTAVVRLSSPSPKTVTLAPGAKVSSSIAFGVVPTGSEPDVGSCEPEASSIRVTPPDAKTSLNAAWTLGPVCAKGRLATNAFVAGNGG